MEIVSVRAAATRLAGALTEQFPSHRTDAAIDRTPISRRPAYFGPVDGWFDTPVFADRRAVKDLAGPLIVEEADATVVVAPGWRVDCDPADRLRLTREAM
jgi:N-methylhydantoinase A